VLYLAAGYFAFTTPVITAVVLTSFLAIALIIAGIIRSVNAFILDQFQAGAGYCFQAY
jgi:uncharacterized membrane protein HdeD (DUF308 family)